MTTRLLAPTGFAAFAILVSGCTTPLSSTKLSEESIYVGRLHIRDAPAVVQERLDPNKRTLRAISPNWRQTGAQDLSRVIATPDRMFMTNTSGSRVFVTWLNLAAVKPAIRTGRFKLPFIGKKEEPQPRQPGRRMGLQAEEDEQTSKLVRYQLTLKDKGVRGHKITIRGIETREDLADICYAIKLLRTGRR